MGLIIPKGYLMTWPLSSLKRGVGSFGIVHGVYNNIYLQEEAIGLLLSSST